MPQPRCRSSISSMLPLPSSGRSQRFPACAPLGSISNRYDHRTWSLLQVKWSLRGERLCAVQPVPYRSLAWSSLGSNVVRGPWPCRRSRSPLQVSARAESFPYRADPQRISFRDFCCGPLGRDRFAGWLVAAKPPCRREARTASSELGAADPPRRHEAGCACQRGCGQHNKREGRITRAG